MWNNYSRDYIKNNRASSMSIMAAALIATMFLSLLCSTAYNVWIYEVEQIILEEGDWQGRIVCDAAGHDAIACDTFVCDTTGRDTSGHDTTGCDTSARDTTGYDTTGRDTFEEADLFLIHQFANVEKAVINEELSKQGETVVDIWFQNARTIYRDMPSIAAQLGLEEDCIQYHSLLLSRYFIHDPADETPPMLLTLYLIILIIAALSLILIIRGSFELSMNARIHQFGIFSSIGATSGQIRSCLLQEAAVLSVLPMILGSLLGIIINYGFIGAVNFFAIDVAERHEAIFHYSPSVLAVTLSVSLLTVLFSAWIPARKLSRMTPLEAIRNTGGFQLKKRRHSRILSMFFGIKGELAGNALKAQKKSMRISALSLLLSFLGFSIMLVFTTLADISTRYTYFERYQDAWDIMITLKDRSISDFSLTEEVQNLSGVRDAAVYQKAETVMLLPEELQSQELSALGGLESVAGTPRIENQFQVSVPIVILDDASFLNFCSQIGITPSLDGAIVLNQIWDSINSNFRYREYVPFVKEDSQTTILGTGTDGKRAEIPVLSYTQAVPVLREEYKDYALVHFIPLALWDETLEQICEVESDSYIRILASGATDVVGLSSNGAADSVGLPSDPIADSAGRPSGSIAEPVSPLSNPTASLALLDSLEKQAVELVSQEYKIQSENRVQERLSNDNLIYGMKVILGAFCILLAIIGIANVYSNTLGFLRQRKREFAQYMSVGLTPRDMRDMFFIEALVTAGKPLLITFPLTVLFVQFAVNASYLDPKVFWAEAPILPVLIFAAAIVLFVALAYYIGGRRILRCNLNEILRNDALV